MAVRSARVRLRPPTRRATGSDACHPLRHHQTRVPVRVPIPRGVVDCRNRIVQASWAGVRRRRGVLHRPRQPSWRRFGHGNVWQQVHRERAYDESKRTLLVCSAEGLTFNLQSEDPEVDDRVDGSPERGDHLELVTPTQGLRQDLRPAQPLLLITLYEDARPSTCVQGRALLFSAFVCVLSACSASLDVDIRGLRIPLDKRFS